MQRILETREFFRGASSPLTKIFGNITSVLRPLRQQFYFEIGLEDEEDLVREVFPEWDKFNKKVVWVDEVVAPRNDWELMETFLQDPFEGIKYFFGQYFDGRVPKPESVSKILWENH